MRERNINIPSIQQAVITDFSEDEQYTDEESIERKPFLDNDAYSSIDGRKNNFKTADVPYATYLKTANKSGFPSHQNRTAIELDISVIEGDRHK